MAHGAHDHDPSQLDSGFTQALAETMQALSTPSRLRILGRLHAGPCPVNDLAAAVGMECAVNTKRAPSGTVCAAALIASENILSPAVRAQLGTDLAGRYGDYAGRDAAHRKYFGTPFVVEIAERVEKKRFERKQADTHVITDLKSEFEKVGLKADTTGRPKHFYSIHKKMLKGRDFSPIYDLTAVRVIVDSVKDCYGALGVVHAMWKPLPGRFKDYIAMPKPNMYQSLHTTVVGPEGEPLEIQIRTWEMHRTSEYGIAAHWRYKEGVKPDQFENKLSWLRALLEWQKDMRDSRVFMENLKLDLFDSQVFVFSPRGDVFSMPAGGSPLDFAYNVHTDVGNHCVGARVNGRIVPLDYQLQNGDICEILVNKSTGRPSLDWLSLVKTSSAKHKIKQWFRKEKREENVLAGQEAVEHELARRHVGLDALRGDLIEHIAHRMNYTSTKDLFAAIGFGDASANSVVNRLKDDLKSSNVIQIGRLRPPSVSRRTARKATGIRIAGVDDVLVRLSKCCSPVPGDPIMGYVTIGRGVSVHRADCPNVAYMNAAPERILEATWADATSITHAVDIEIEATDRPGLLQDVMGVCDEQKTQVSTVNARVKRAHEEIKAMPEVTARTVSMKDIERDVDWSTAVDSEESLVDPAWGAFGRTPTFRSTTPPPAAAALQRHAEPFGAAPRRGEGPGRRLQRAARRRSRATAGRWPWEHSPGISNSLSRQAHGRRSVGLRSVSTPIESTCGSTTPPTAARSRPASRSTPSKAGPSSPGRSRCPTGP